MKKSLLLVSLLLGVVACRRVDTIPTTQQIQSKAPKGALVRVVLRDRVNPQRVTTYTVDVSRNEIVDTQDRAPSATRGAQETSSSEEGTTSAMQQQNPAPTPRISATAEFLTDCKPKDEKEGCRNVADLNDGDPRGSSGGGGDPTGHQSLQGRILRLAALIYWSSLEVGIPTYNKTLQAPPVDGPVQR
ncbi:MULTISPECIES: hypothetical protein [Myxococcus]|uniref:hypothetical protein n=1 Tax=Myxococcus TaxID=32 RepID=UPI0013D5BB5D|nr:MULTISPECIES: hypothetical protein [Myxococcus]NVJ26052.1 hypothetical protein [Myxococcus sp. AM011]